MAEPGIGQDRKLNRKIARNEEARQSTSALRVSGTAIVVTVLIVACGFMVVWLVGR